MDNIFRLFGRLNRREDVPGIPPSTKASETAAAEGTGGDWKGNIPYTGGRHSLLVPAWFRGVTVIMHTMGQMVVQYQRLNREGGNFVEATYGPDRLFNYLLQVRPNPQMAASTMLEQIEFLKIYKGNAYVYIDRDDMGNVAALWLCSSGSYDAIADQYTVTFQRRGGLTTVTVPSTDVLHFRNTYLEDNFMTGIPTLRYAQEALSIAAAANNQTLMDMAKGGKHKIILQEKPTNSGSSWGLVGGMADPNQMKKISKQFEADMLSGDVMLLNNIVDTKIISQTAQELRTLENRNFQVADIARLLGVPKIMMMDDSGSSYKSPEAATQEFLLRTISPRVREYEDELNAKLLNAYDFGQRRIHVCEQSLRRLDPTGQANLDKVRLETGVMSPNELRAQYDLGTIPDGDKHYVSTNLAEVGSEKLRAASGGSSSSSGSSANPSNPSDPSDPSTDPAEKGGDE
jgi:HK97 family phage portal protein